MESKIDWSKAPEGCIGAFTSKHDFRSVGFSSFFVITKRYSDYGAQAGCSGEDQDGKEYHVFEKYWDYHEKPASWSGEGLPPVGVVCELRCLPVGGWGKAEIKYMSETQCVWLWLREDGGYQVELAEVPDETRMAFRPIRTPEQIATELADQAIKEIAGIICRDGAFDIDDPEVTESAVALYDAGYRKP